MQLKSIKFPKISPGSIFLIVLALSFVVGMMNLVTINLPDVDFGFIPTIWRWIKNFGDPLFLFSLAILIGIAIYAGIKYAGGGSVWITRIAMVCLLIITGGYLIFGDKVYEVGGKIRSDIYAGIMGIETTESGVVLNQWQQYRVPPIGSEPLEIPVGKRVVCYDRGRGMYYSVGYKNWDTAKSAITLVSTTPMEVDAEILIAKSRAAAEKIHPTCK